ncbi:MAG: hypothetical protein KDB94_03480, partial [Acidobacteria bacterium]|nr:hypothetical protein [Acidobacteriota bacterium]
MRRHVTAARSLTTHHLKQHDPDGIEIAAPVERRVAVALFRRHVGECAGDALAFLRQQAARLHDALRRDLARLAETEVRHLHVFHVDRFDGLLPAAVDQDVGRLDIA